ncbi:SKI2 [Symbiodinium sp. CCMP2592]|nr:SKI2 [Symbiodinium sp. CCMP2592]
MRGVFNLLLFVSGVSAVRPGANVDETFGTCCCFFPATNRFRAFKPAQGQQCPKRKEGSTEKLPRGCAREGGDVHTPCQTKDYNEEGVPDPNDMYCENYLMATCGDHTISIPKEWTNCYEKTSKYGYNQVESSCPQCKRPYYSRGKC